jgi:hypothetical protein
MPVSRSCDARTHPCQWLLLRITTVISGIKQLRLPNGIVHMTRAKWARGVFPGMGQTPAKGTGGRLEVLKALATKKAI